LDISGKVPTKKKPIILLLIIIIIIIIMMMMMIGGGALDGEDDHLRLSATARRSRRGNA